MLVKRVLVTASASLAGLLLLACGGSSVWAQQQKVLFCNIPMTGNAPTIAAGKSGVVTCSTVQQPLSAIISPAEDLRVEYVDADAQTSDPSLVIDSIEVTLNVNDSSNNLIDFMDVGFSPYAHVTGGGGITSNLSTFGGLNSPNIDMLKSTITGWINPQGFGNANNYQYELQVFVTNTGTKTQYATGTLRVIQSINTL